MKNQQRIVTELYEGLQALLDAAFPKKCTGCGKTFMTLKEFLQGTYSTISSSGLKLSEQNTKRPVVELYRSCQCGATLMEFFHDRRDDSETGAMVRAKFAQLLDMLKNTGLSLGTARAELVQLLRGGQSQIFNMLGLHIDFRS